MRIYDIKKGFMLFLSLRILCCYIKDYVIFSDEFFMLSKNYAIEWYFMSYLIETVADYVIKYLFMLAWKKIKNYAIK